MTTDAGTLARPAARRRKSGPGGGGGMQFDLRAAVYCEDGGWLAHCLELDIVAEGASPDAAVRDLIDLCALQIKTALSDGDVTGVFRPAPPEIVKLYFLGRRRPGVVRTVAPVASWEVHQVDIAGA